ncbi:MAG: hypothetical protein ABI230_12270, partial [Aestuariivirga sp.]
MRLISILAYFFLGTISAAHADNLQLFGAQHWLAIASDKDKDVAIGIARQQYGLRDRVRVVASKSGYYAVIAGPYEGYSIQDISKNDKNISVEELPKDALLSYGANYTETIWQPQPQSAYAKLAYTLDKSAQFSAGKLSVTVKGVKLDADTGYTQVDGTGAQGSFHFDLGKDAPADQMMSADSLTSEDFNHAAVVRLLPGAVTPQVVITNFTGGAHCCTDTTILARPPGSEAWLAIKGATLDGDGGYWFEDVTDTGTQELMSVDNAFLYAFDSYAGSFAPLHISKLSGGAIEDISQDPSMRPRLVQDLAGMEFSAKVHPELWQSNGFLVAWVASKIRLGQGDAAWAKFMANYDRASTFG